MLSSSLSLVVVIEISPSSPAVKETDKTDLRRLTFPLSMAVVRRAVTYFSNSAGASSGCCDAGTLKSRNEEESIEYK